MDIDPIELFKDDAEHLYARIDEVLNNANDVGYLTKDEIMDLMGLFHTLKGNASMIEAYKYIAFIQDVESFLMKIRTYNLFNLGQDLIDICIETANVTKDIIVLEYEDRLEWDEYITATNEILKLHNNLVFKNAESFFENCS
jgi:chemotaxis protein histidine kinase CheA